MNTHTRTLRPNNNRRTLPVQLESRYGNPDGTRNDVDQQRRLEAIAGGMFAGMFEGLAAIHRQSPAKLRNLTGAPK